jgi:hypothetical protein
MIEKLKEYKEVIVIIVFFLGGFFWLENQYPKKTDLKSEIGVLNCLLEKYMTLTQYQIRGQELEKQIQELNNQIQLFYVESKNRSRIVSPGMKHEMDEKKSDLSGKKKDLKENKDAMEKISCELERNVCGKVSP